MVEWLAVNNYCETLKFIFHLEELENSERELIKSEFH